MDDKALIMGAKVLKFHMFIGKWNVFDDLHLKQLGGLLAIFSQILNGLNYSSALVKMEKNLCGFIPAFLSNGFEFRS